MAPGKSGRVRGEQGERLAEEFLRKLGCKVLRRNWHSRLGEIDLIVRDGDEVVFVEVKLRASGDWGAPAGSRRPPERGAASASPRASSRTGTACTGTRSGSTSLPCSCRPAARRKSGTTRTRSPSCVPQAEALRAEPQGRAGSPIKRRRFDAFTPNRLAFAPAAWVCPPHIIPHSRATGPRPHCAQFTRAAAAINRADARSSHRKNSYAARRQEAPPRLVVI